MPYYLGKPQPGEPRPGPIIGCATRDDALQTLARVPRDWILVEAASLADAQPWFQVPPALPAAPR